MNANVEFDEIRPYHDEELPQVYEELIADAAFRQAVDTVMPGVPFEVWSQKMRACKTKLEFQKTFCYGLLWKLAKEATDGLTLDHTALPADKSAAYTYISNHRDIILDSGFLSILLVDQGMDTVEIAIGDNLLVYPWIKKFVRVNKSFIVLRALTMRQMLEASARMSRYMHYTISEKKQSIWIAQREGRAKDSNDRTQDSVLKMLAIGGEGDVIDRLMEMNIAPLAISYEYDPCDFLKAQEFQLKRDIEGYKKTTADDLLNMQTGLFGYKGRVHFQTGACMNDELAKMDRSLPKPELFARMSALIDKRIHASYRMYPNNYVAHDLLEGKEDFSDHYTAEDKQRFTAYIEQQLERISIPNKDVVETLEGPLLVLAGAGSGKTRALTYRVANLLEHGVPPWAIMAITFTNKAAKEMRERIEKLAGAGAEDIWVSTFHSGCAKILRRDIEKLGYTRSFTIYDDDDQMSALKEILKKLNIDDKFLPPREIKGKISDAKNKLLGPQDWFSQSERDYRSQLVYDVYQAYEEKLKSSNALDFDDLIVKTLELFAQHPPVLEAYQRKIRYIHVDEYQDTNYAQYMLVRLLAAQRRNLCVCRG